MSPVRIKAHFAAQTTVSARQLKLLGRLLQCACCSIINLNIALKIGITVRAYLHRQYIATVSNLAYLNVRNRNIRKTKAVYKTRHHLYSHIAVSQAITSIQFLIRRQCAFLVYLGLSSRTKTSTQRHILQYGRLYMVKSC